MKSNSQLLGKKIVIRQTRSAIGRDGRFKGTVCALGLGRIGKSCAQTVTPAILGMLKRVQSVIEVSVVK